MACEGAKSTIAEPSPELDCDAQYRCASSFLRFGSSDVGFDGSAEVLAGLEVCERESR